MIKNKIFKLTLLSSVLLYTSSYAEDKPLSTEKLTELKQTVKVFKNRPVTLIDGIDKGPYYFIQLSTNNKIVNAFLEKESGAVYIGHRYDKNGVKMTFPKTAKSIATIKEGISFSYGKGEKDLYIVTDPQCPYCVRFEKQAKGKLEDTYKVHIILYPLSFHKKAPAMVEWIMQGKDDAEKKQRMEEVMINNSQDYMAFMGKKGERFKYTDSIKVKVDNAIKAAKALGATGTPSVYVGKEFNKISWKSLVMPKRPPFKPVIKPSTEANKTK